MEIIVIDKNGEYKKIEEKFDMSPNEAIKEIMKEIDFSLGDNIYIREYGD